MGDGSGIDGKVIGYVPGVFDMFHIGHLNILRRSRERCDVLVAGVVTDDAVELMKGHRPIVPENERMEIVAANRYVDEVLIDRSERGNRRGSLAVLAEALRPQLDVPVRQALQAVAIGKQHAD